MDAEPGQEKPGSHDEHEALASERLGPLRFEHHAYRGSVLVGGTRLSVSVESRDDLRRCEGLWHCLLERLDEIRVNVATRMRADAVQWAEDSSDVPDEAGLAACFVPRSVRLGDGRSAVLYLGDGGLFAGHDIEVFVDATGTVTHAQLIG